MTTTYDRDELDRVTAIDYPGTASDVSLTYDDAGRVTRMQDGAADTKYDYDTYGGVTKYDQLLAVERKYGTMTSYRATRYDYDQDYNRTTMVDGEGNATGYAYDEDNRLSQITRGPYITTFGYDETGNRTLKTLPNDAHTEYTYNDRNWLTSLENRKEDDTLISSYAYGHDDVGNRTSMTEANGDVTSYTYDNVYRLADETKRDSGNNVLYRYQYTYDGVGNRLTETNTGQISYTYDSNNKLTQLVGPGGTTTFGYDDNGNTTSMTQPGPVVTSYGYDYENRLASVTDNANYTAAYTYSAEGLRLRVQESNNPNPDRWLQYDGVRPVLEGTLSGDTFTTINKYVWEGNSYYSPLMYSLIGGSWRYHFYDGLGSTRQLMLHASPYTVTDTYSYEAFGNLIASTGTTPNPYRYVGSLGYYQTGSSLMHLGERYYMPEVGRFTGRDRMLSRRSRGGNVGDSAAYSYPTNPLLRVDPQGLLTDAEYDCRLAAASCLVATAIVTSGGAVGAATAPEGAGCIVLVAAVAAAAGAGLVCGDAAIKCRKAHWEPLASDLQALADALNAIARTPIRSKCCQGGYWNVWDPVTNPILPPPF